MEGIKKAIIQSRRSDVEIRFFFFHPTFKDPVLPPESDLSVLYSTGYLVGQRLARHPSLPDALICQQDSIAEGLIRAFIEQGIRVPWDVAVTGFENDPSSSAGSLPLTSGEQPLDDLSDRAVSDLVALIREGTPLPSRMTVLPCRLYIRQSSVRRHLPPLVPRISLDGLISELTPRQRKHTPKEAKL